MINYKNKSHFRSLYAVFFIVFFFGLSTIVFAGVDDVSSFEKQASSLYYRSDLVLEKVVENIAVIDGKKYFLTDQTHLVSMGKSIKKQKIREISCPCLVDLVYREYKVMSEGVPFSLGSKILEKLTIVKKIVED